MDISLDNIEKRYSDIPYPDGKQDRVNLVKEILLYSPHELNDKASCAQLLIDIFGDQVALYESLHEEDEYLIFHWVEKNWDSNSFEDTDLLISVLLHLQLKEVKGFLVEKKDTSNNTRIEKMLLEAISELD